MEGTRGHDATLGVDLRVLVTALSGAAGIVHLALVPNRWRDAVVLGIGFAVVGWAQILAAAVARREPPRSFWRALVLGNAVLVGLWLAGHVVGLPFGVRSWETEPVHVADVAVVAFELLVIAAAALQLALPGLVAGARRGDTRLTSAVTVIVIAVATTATLASPGVLARRDDTAVAGATAAPATPPTSVASSAPRVAGLEDQPGGTLPLTGPGTTVVSSTSAGSAMTPTTAPATTKPLPDTGLSALLGGRRVYDEVPIDHATRVALAEQLAVTSTLATRYPTIAAAEAAGYRRAGPFSPGTGTPYAPPRRPANPDGRMDATDLADAVLLYDGTTPPSRLAGFVYLSTRAQTEGEPEGFAGPNDHWTFATDVCTVATATAVDLTPFGVDRRVSREQCNAAGGSLVIAAYFTLHVWTVPGYEATGGVFADVNPAITCADGTYLTKPIESLGASGSLCRN